MQGIYDIDEIYKVIGTDTNSNLEIKSKTVNTKEALCDDTDNTQCKLGSITTFTITIGYANNGYDSANTSHLVELDFDFRRVYEITYSGFSDTTGLPNQMIDGDRLVVDFGEDAPARISVTGSDNYTYLEGVLTVSNVSSDITLKALFNDLTVTYMANGGYFKDDYTITSNVVVYRDGETISGDDILPKNEKLRVEGWYLSPTLEDESKVDIKNYVASDNLVVYAKWVSDRAKFNWRTIMRFLHDSSNITVENDDGTTTTGRLKQLIKYYKEADSPPEWAVGKNWNSNITGNYYNSTIDDVYIYGNNGYDSTHNVPIIFWYQKSTRTVYWYSEDKSPIVTYTDQHGKSFGFDGHNALIDFSGTRNFDFSELDYMDSFFNACTHLIDLEPARYWNVSNVTSMNKTFSNLTSLTDASAINDWDISNVTSFTEMFYKTSVKPTFTKVLGTFSGNGTFVPSG